VSTISLYAGQGNGPKLYGFLESMLDDATAYTPYMESASFWPAGAQGEAIFPVCYLTLTWTTATSIRVTPILDGVVYDGTGGTTDERLTFALGSSTNRQTDTFEIPLTRPLLDSVDGVTEIGRLAMRGARLALRIETTGSLGSGDLILDGVWVEYQEVTSSREPAALP